MDNVRRPWFIGWKSSFILLLILGALEKSACAEYIKREVESIRGSHV
jgi:hypothetical protein